MSIFLWNSEPSKIFVWSNEVASVRAGDTKVRPSADTRTFTISWTEGKNMPYWWWTYSDDAAWLTAWSGDFDDFFWYSAVLLNTSGVETAEMAQTWWVFTGVMTTLGNITNWDNVMIKFPVRWIKMTKSWSVVTLSITAALGRESEWYQYYAHCTWTLSNPWSPKGAFYLWAYKAYNNSNVLKSWSWYTPKAYTTEADFCTYAKANGSWYNIIGFYQRMYITALYMMKYGSPDSQRKIWLWEPDRERGTWWTNSQTAANYWYPSTYTQIRLFWLEDRWGSLNELIWGCYTNGSKVLYTSLTWWSWTTSWWESTWVTTSPRASNKVISSISGENKAMFAPRATNEDDYDTYYCDYTRINASCLLNCGGRNSGYYRWLWIFAYDQTWWTGTFSSYLGTRLMYLNWLT